MEDDDQELTTQLAEVGAKIKVRWNKDDIGDSGWKTGWYVAYVQGYNAESDILTLEYPSEPGCTYSVELTPMITSGTIKLVQAVSSKLFPHLSCII